MFFRGLILMFATLAYVTTRVVYTGSAAYPSASLAIKIHPSILFNLSRFRSEWDGFISWCLFLAILCTVCVVWWFSLFVIWIQEYLDSQDAVFAWPKLTPLFLILTANYFKRGMDDPNAYDDEDWHSQVISYEELAEECDYNKRTLELYRLEEEERIRLEEEERISAQTEQALSVSPPPPPEEPSYVLDSQSASVPCLIPLNIFALSTLCLSLTQPRSHTLLSLFRLTEQLPRGFWKMQHFNGQMMEVLIHEGDGKVMASRRPGDTRYEWGIY